MWCILKRSRGISTGEASIAHYSRFQRLKSEQPEGGGGHIIETSECQLWVPFLFLRDEWYVTSNPCAKSYYPSKCLRLQWKAFPEQRFCKRTWSEVKTESAVIMGLAHEQGRNFSRWNALAEPGLPVLWRCAPVICSAWNAAYFWYNDPSVSNPTRWAQADLLVRQCFFCTLP